VVLLSGAGLLIKTMARIHGIDLGFRTEHVLMLRVPGSARGRVRNLRGEWRRWRE